MSTLTVEQIETLEAGPVANLLVMEAIGGDLIPMTGMNEDSLPEHFAKMVRFDGQVFDRISKWRPSTNWGDAMFAAERSVGGICVQFPSLCDSKQYEAGWYEGLSDDLAFECYGRAATGPLAICKMILRMFYCQWPSGVVEDPKFDPFKPLLLTTDQSTGKTFPGTGIVKPENKPE